MCHVKDASQTEHGALLALRRSQTEIHLNSARILRAMERRIASMFAREGLDMTPAQANVLVLLFHRRDAMTAAQLANELSVSQATVTRFVQSLESRGWIARQKDPEDARALLMTLTPKAYEQLPSMIRLSNRMLDEAFEGLEPHDVGKLAEWIAKIRHNLTAEGP